MFRCPAAKICIDLQYQELHKEKVRGHKKNMFGS